MPFSQVLKEATISDILASLAKAFPVIKQEKQTHIKQKPSRGQEDSNSSVALGRSGTGSPCHFQVICLCPTHNQFCIT